MSNVSQIIDLYIKLHGIKKLAHTYQVPTAFLHSYLLNSREFRRMVYEHFKLRYQNSLFRLSRILEEYQERMPIAPELLPLKEAIIPDDYYDIEVFYDPQHLLIYIPNDKEMGFQPIHALLLVKNQLKDNRVLMDVAVIKDLPPLTLHYTYHHNLWDLLTSHRLKRKKDAEQIIQYLDDYIITYRVQYIQVYCKLIMDTKQTNLAPLYLMYESKLHKIDYTENPIERRNSIFNNTLSELLTIIRSYLFKGYYPSYIKIIPYLYISLKGFKRYEPVQYLYEYSYQQERFVSWHQTGFTLLSPENFNSSRLYHISKEEVIK